MQKNLAMKSMSVSDAFAVVNGSGHVRLFSLNIITVTSHRFARDGILFLSGQWSPLQTNNAERRGVSSEDVGHTNRETCARAQSVHRGSGRTWDNLRIGRIRAAGAQHKKRTADAICSYAIVYFAAGAFVRAWGSVVKEGSARVEAIRLRAA